jgi:hypothetical protein
MDCIELLERIRSTIRARLVALGGSTDRTPQEAILIRDGRFCGRRFDTDGLHAVWFAEENEIKFYDRDGAVHEVLELTLENLADESRKAA